MVNDRLRLALIQRGISSDRLADKLGVDKKTVQRWITPGRIPNSNNRTAIAKELGTEETHLWPDISSYDTSLRPDREQEIITTYPDRASVPREVWIRLLSEATSHIDVWVYSGTFLAQTNPNIAAMLAERAAQGAEVRLLFGDPDSEATARRAAEEGIDGALGPKIRSSLSHFTSLVGTPNCAVRLHQVTVYASLFRYDNQALINPHILGSQASGNPLLLVQDVGEQGMFSRYLASFDRCWKEATPWQP